MNGKINQLINISKKFDVKENNYEAVQLIGWPLIFREILADYIFNMFKFDIRLKYKVIESVTGNYNFDLLWAEKEKILCAKNHIDNENKKRLI